MSNSVTGTELTAGVAGYDLFSNAADDNTPFFKSAWRKLKAKVNRAIPRLVWPGQEIDVIIVFKGDKLTLQVPEDAEFPLSDEVMKKMADEAAKVIHDSPIEQAEVMLRRAGIAFDTGIGGHGRDWFFDYSLGGPVSVVFRGHARSPERRTN